MNIDNNNIEIINKMINIDNIDNIDNINNTLNDADNNFIIKESNDNQSLLYKVTTMDIIRNTSNSDPDLIEESIISNDNKEKKKEKYKGLLHTTNEKFISIFLHIFIMASFEAYFYFDYVIKLEKQLLVDKINQYLDQVNEFYISHKSDNTDLYIKYLFGKYYEDDAKDYLENEYDESKRDQELMLNKLILFCYKLVASIFCFLVFFVACGFFHKKVIKWKWILIENFFLFGLLGIFEYIFLTNVILKYSPFSDAELKYMVYKEMFNIINGTYDK
jgi:hypothetical protein